MNKQELIGMRLDDALTRMNPEQIVSFGSKSGYIEILPASVLLERLDRLSNKQFNKFCRMLQRKECRIKYLQSKQTDKKVEKALNEAKAQEQYLHRVIDEFIPLRDRKVKDIYKRTLADNGIAVIVDGCENGQFWLASEKRR